MPSFAYLTCKALQHKENFQLFIIDVVVRALIHLHTSLPPRIIGKEGWTGPHKVNYSSPLLKA